MKVKIIKQDDGKLTVWGQRTSLREKVVPAVPNVERANLREVTARIVNAMRGISVPA